MVNNTRCYIQSNSIINRRKEPRRGYNVLYVYSFCHRICCRFVLFRYHISNPFDIPRRNERTWLNGCTYIFMPTKRVQFRYMRCYYIWYILQLIEVHKYKLLVHERAHDSTRTAQIYAIYYNIVQYVQWMAVNNLMAKHKNLNLGFKNGKCITVCFSFFTLFFGCLFDSKFFVLSLFLSVYTKPALKAIHLGMGSQTGILKQWNILLCIVHTKCDTWATGMKTMRRWRGDDVKTPSRRRFNRFSQIYSYLSINLFSSFFIFINVQICQRGFLWNFALSLVFVLFLQYHCIPFITINLFFAICSRGGIKNGN